MDTRIGSRERPLHIGIVACSSEGAVVILRAAVPVIALTSS